MASAFTKHECHGTPENAFSAFFGKDRPRNPVLGKIARFDVITKILKRL